MHHIEEMIAAHPDVKGSTNEALIRCIEQCFICEQFCISCADACLAEETVADLRQSIRLNLDCADVCLAAGKLVIRRTGSNDQGIVAILQVCEGACRICAEECDRHAAHMEHCRLCAEECRRCEKACVEAISSLR